MIGIDPGVKGGWAILSEAGNLIAVGPAPVTDGEFCVAGMAAIFQTHQPTHFVIERVNGRGMGCIGSVHYWILLANHLRQIETE
jgi:hypothetical protein